VSDPERLSQLRRQRAAIAEHLAWLDQEIQRAAQHSRTETPTNPLPAPPHSLPPATVPVAKPPPTQLEANNPSPALSADPDAVLEEWTETSGQGDKTNQPISKMGCWLIFAGLAAATLGGIALFIWIFYS
jgi:hypothetical protein